MPCYHPLTAYYARKENDSGKRSLVFDVSLALADVPVQIPCGRCIGCRLDRSLSWALRCVHEASLHDQNCFVTLTFNDSSLPSDASLKVADFQNFMKRLRQEVSPRKVRFFIVVSMVLSFLVLIIMRACLVMISRIKFYLRSLRKGIFILLNYWLSCGRLVFLLLVMLRLKVLRMLLVM